MNKRSLQIAALALAVIVALGAVYGPRLLRWQRSQQGPSNPLSAQGQRKVLYYYDAMNPQNHYGKPGKAPDGMDLVPQYAADAANADQTAGQEAALTEHKILYWYDP